MKKFLLFAAIPFAVIAAAVTTTYAADIADSSTIDTRLALEMRQPSVVQAGGVASYTVVVHNYTSHVVDAQVVVTRVSDGGPEVAYANRTLVDRAYGLTWNTGRFGPGDSKKLKIGFKVPYGPNSRFCAGLTMYSKYAGGASATYIPCSPVLRP